MKVYEGLFIFSVEVAAAENVPQKSPVGFRSSKALLIRSPKSEHASSVSEYKKLAEGKVFAK